MGWDSAKKTANVIISNGGLDAELNDTNYGVVLAEEQIDLLNNYYVEYLFKQKVSDWAWFGVTTTLASTSNQYAGRTSGQPGASLRANGQIYYNGIGTGVVTPELNEGDNVGIAVDIPSGLVYFRVNGVWINSADPENGTGGTPLGTTTQPCYPTVGMTWTVTNKIGIVTNNVYSVPSGFIPLYTPITFEINTGQIISSSNFNDFIVLEREFWTGNLVATHQLNKGPFTLGPYLENKHRLLVAYPKIDSHYQLNQNYSVGDYVFIDSNKMVVQCATAGTTDANNEPAWTESTGINDGTCVWDFVDYMIDPIALGPLLPTQVV